MINRLQRGWLELSLPEFGLVVKKSTEQARSPFIKIMTNIIFVLEQLNRKPSPSVTQHDGCHLA